MRKKYKKEEFTQRTQGLIDFIEKEIEFNKNIKIVDMGLGTGWHAIELFIRAIKLLGWTFLNLSWIRHDKCR